MQRENENKIRRHAEFNSASSTHDVSQEKRQRQTWKTLNQVQGDNIHLHNGNNAGFTLIELLVVVLIFGILAAVALPQYQKAVEKSRATQAITLLKSIGQAAEVYHLANGNWPASFDELGVEPPNWTGTTKGYTANGVSDAVSNNDWSLQWWNYPGEIESHVLYITRMNGSYAGGGFAYALARPDNVPTGQVVCIERKQLGVTFSGADGSYCQKLLKGIFKDQTSDHRFYALP